MFIDELPSRKIGYLGPRHVIENQPYEFYRLAPPGVILVMVSCGLDQFTADDVERVTKPIDKLLDMLMERDCEIYNQVGVPLPLLVGLEAHDALAEAERAWGAAWPLVESTATRLVCGKPPAESKLPPA